VLKGRTRFGAQLVPTDTKGVRALFQALAANELVLILPDQDPRDSGGIFAPFFGIQANTMTLASRLAQKSGAIPVLAIAERLSWGRGFRMHYLPLEIDEKSLEGHVAAINRAVEQAIRCYPEQYQWSYKRFRTRPEGEGEIY
jgi:Kdo2-lipid IVA lauroyltransferase/acyltransferase